VEATQVAEVNKEEDDVKKPKSVRRKQQTVRERTQVDANKPRRIRRTAGKVANPLRKAGGLGRKEYHVVPLPANKAGSILSRRVRIIPKFIQEAWQEIRQVTWPSARETFRLTMAVFIFSIIFAVIVGLLDYVLDKVFREVIINR
jgi:preprotein translocase subunit SecE